MIKRRLKQLCVYMPDCGQAGVIQIWQPGEGKWVEFRGPAYSMWDDLPCPMKLVHDTLDGWHTTVLHQGSVLLLHEDHLDFARIWKLYAGAEREPVVVASGTPMARSVCVA